MKENIDALRQESSNRKIGAMVLRKSRKLAKECAERIRMLLCEQGCNFRKTAEVLFPQSPNIKISTSIVSHAARLILSEEELDAVRTRSCDEGNRKGGLAYDSTEALLKVQGLAAWSDAERKRLAELFLNHAYRHTDGRHKGAPHHEKILACLNHEFFDERPARTVHAVMREIAKLQREGGKESKKFIDWKRVRPVLLKLTADPEYQHPASALFGRGGTPNWQKIAKALTEQFPDQPTITPKDCSCTGMKDFERNRNTEI